MATAAQTQAGYQTGPINNLLGGNPTDPSHSGQWQQNQYSGLAGQLITGAVGQAGQGVGLYNANYGNLWNQYLSNAGVNYQLQQPGQTGQPGQQGSTTAPGQQGSTTAPGQPQVPGTQAPNGQNNPFQLSPVYQQEANNITSRYTQQAQEAVSAYNSQAATNGMAPNPAGATAINEYYANLGNTQLIGLQQQQQQQEQAALQNAIQSMSGLNSQGIQTGLEGAGLAFTGGNQSLALGQAQQQQDWQVPNALLGVGATLGGAYLGAPQLNNPTISGSGSGSGSGDDFGYDFGSGDGFGSGYGFGVGGLGG